MSNSTTTFIDSSVPTMKTTIKHNDNGITTVTNARKTLKATYFGVPAGPYNEKYWVIERMTYGSDNEWHLVLPRWHGRTEEHALSLAEEWVS